MTDIIDVDPQWCDDTQNYPSLDYNQWLKRLNTQLNEPTNQSLIIVPKDG